MKKIAMILLVVAVVFTFFQACDAPQQTSDRVQAAQTEQMLQELNREVGLPNITNFQQKKLMKMIMEECDKESLICYAYLQSEMTGKLVYIGKYLGYGIPFSAQFTNPEKIAYKQHNVGAVTLPQADPNGLFMPTSSSATWLLMVDDTNTPRVVYLEPSIVVSPFKLNLGVE